VRNDATIELAHPGAIRPARARAMKWLSRAIFFPLLLLIVLVAMPYGTVEPWWEAVFECVVFAFGALWIVEGLLGGEWFVREHRLLLPLVALIVFTFIQSLTWANASAMTGIGARWALSADAYETRLVTLRLLALTLVAGMLLRYTSNRHRLRALIYVVIGVGVASALFGIMRQTTQREAGFVLPYLLPNEGYGQFINRNHFAYLMEMSLGLALGLIIGGGVRRDHALIYLAASLPVWTALVLSNSRGGLIGMFAQLIFIALMFPTVRPPREAAMPESGALRWLWRHSRSVAFRGALLACLVIAMVVGTVWMGGDPLLNRVQSVSGEVNGGDAEHVNRPEIWRATWRLIKDHPIAGVGFGGYRVAFPEYHNGSGRLIPREAHNDYLELLASGGVIGIALGAWFAVLFIKRVRHTLRAANSFRRAACLGALVGLFGVTVHNLFDFGLHITINSLVFITLIVIATLDNKRGEDEIVVAVRTSNFAGLAESR